MPDGYSYSYISEFTNEVLKTENDYQ